MFGGNSNWRGPMWMPVNVLLIRGLLNMYPFYGDDFKVECPTGSGQQMTLFEVAQGDRATACRASSCAMPTGSGRCTVERRSSRTTRTGATTSCSTSTSTVTTAPDSGASHQTGWTGLVALTLDYFARVDPKVSLETSTRPSVIAVREPVVRS